MKWVTRERPKIDRIACPWLIARFVEAAAEFLYVPGDRVLATARAEGGRSYDVADGDFDHVGELCTFDALMAHFHLDQPARRRLATIVRGADTGRPDLAPECAGLLAVSRGLSAVYTDDHEMLRHGMVVYDALYAWCQTVEGAAS
jgi:hypothetical protein